MVPQEHIAELEQRIRRLEGDLALTLMAVRAPEDAVKVWPVLGDDETRLGEPLGGQTE
jgi:uncharacterized protein with PhoU and TrkA domain